MITVIKYNLLSDGPNTLDANLRKLLNMPIDGAITLKEALAIILAEAAGKRTRTGNTVAFRDVADTKDRITGTLSGQNRTSVTLDGS
jgi:hypothetical protein